jgi:hypothetical protein
VTRKGGKRGEVSDENERHTRTATKTTYLVVEVLYDLLEDRAVDLAEADLALLLLRIRSCKQQTHTRERGGKRKREEVKKGGGSLGPVSMLLMVPDTRAQSRLTRNSCPSLLISFT